MVSCTFDQPMRALIRGAGLAGLSCARTLAEFTAPGTVSVTVLEKRKDLLLDSDRGVGLWPAAQMALDRLGSPGQNLRERGCKTPPAAYRSRNGVWLSRSSGNVASVRTIRENDLRSFLLDGIDWGSKDVTFITDVTSDSDIDYSSFDIVIDASGSSLASNSTAKKSLSVSGIAHSSHMPSLFDLSEGFHPQPFETLIEPSVRIALVPLSSDGHHFFWFISGLEHILEKHGKTGSSPLQDILGSISGIKSHVPISKIIEASKCLEKRVVYQRRDTVHVTTSTSRSNTCELRIGDAANNLPNNLAQGASVALEDGFTIGSILSMGAAISGQDSRESAARSCIEQFKQLRKPRVDKCRTVSSFTQVISDFPLLASGMQFVPAKVNSMVFDAFLNYSLGGGGRDPARVLGPDVDAGDIQNLARISSKDA